MDGALLRIKNKKRNEAVSRKYVRDTMRQIKESERFNERRIIWEKELLGDYETVVTV